MLVMILLSLLLTGLALMVAAVVSGSSEGLRPRSFREALPGHAWADVASDFLRTTPGLRLPTLMTGLSAPFRSPSRLDMQRHG